METTEYPTVEELDKIFQSYKVDTIGMPSSPINLQEEISEPNSTSAMEELLSMTGMTEIKNAISC